LKEKARGFGVQNSACSSTYYGLNALLLSIAIAIPLALAVSCGGPQAVGEDSYTCRTGLSLSILEDTYLGENPTGRFYLRQASDGVSLKAEVWVDGATDLKALFFTLRYDEANLCPVAVTSSGRLEDDVHAEAILRLDVLHLPGEVHSACLPVRPASSGGLCGRGHLATVSFAFRPAGTTRQVSSAPQSQLSRAPLLADSDTGSITWLFANQGDYNQDGEVNSSDLTPLGAHYLAEGPFEETSALWVVDGNQDGYLEVSDITPIGANYLNSIAGGFNVYSGPAGEFPDLATGPSASDPMGSVELSAAAGVRAEDRLSFSYEPPPEAGRDFFWVRGCDRDGNEGIASQLGKIWEVTELLTDVMIVRSWFNNMEVDAQGRAHICFRDEGTNALTYGVYEQGDWTQMLVDNEGMPGDFPSLALDSEGLPSISYVEWEERDLKIASYDGQTWEVETVDAGYVYGGTSLEIDNGGAMHIAYVQPHSKHLIHAVRSGSDWLTEKVNDEGEAGVFFSMALDTRDTPHIAYCSSTLHGSKLMYASRGSSTWSTEVVDDQGDAGHWCSLALDDADRPHITHVEADDALLKYSWRTDGSWATECMTTEGEDALPAGRLRIDERGQPHVAYQTSEHELRVEYAVKAGGVWKRMILPVENIASGGVALALDAGSLPYLCFSNAKNDTLYLVK